jgi:hypothetical protein
MKITTEIELTNEQTQFWEEIKSFNVNIITINSYFSQTEKFLILIHNLKSTHITIFRFYENYQQLDHTEVKIQVTKH